MSADIRPYPEPFRSALDRSGRIESLPDAASITPNAASFYEGTVTLSQNVTINPPSGPVWDTQTYALRMFSTAARTLTFHPDIVWGTDLPAPGSTTGGSKYDYIVLKACKATNKWHGVGKLFGY